MFNIAADHINKVEAKQTAETIANRSRSDREALIAGLRQTIADAERRKVAPIFANEDVETTFNSMKARVENLAAEYENRLWHDLQGGRKYPLDLASEAAVAFFNLDSIIAKLPGLADRINSRSGRGSGIYEEKRAAVVAECEATIAEARAKLDKSPLAS